MKSLKITEKNICLYNNAFIKKENIIIMMLFCVMNVLKPKFSLKFTTNRINMHKTVFVLLPKVMECNKMS